MANNDRYHNGEFPSNSNHSPFSSFTREEKDKEDEIDLKELFFTLWNQKWIVAGTLLICGLLAGIYAVTQTPIYQSDGMMLIEDSQGSSPLGGDDGIGQLMSSSFGLGGGSALANELLVLRSRALSKAVADSLVERGVMANGRQYPILFSSYPRDSAVVSKDTVAARLREGLRFARIDREADVVQIVYESPAPLAAADVVNLTMQTYQNISKSENRSAANSATAFLANEKQRIEQSLQNAEQKLRAFMNESNLVQVDAQTQELIKQMAELEARKQEARAKLVAANAAIEQYSSQLNEIKPGLAEQYAKAVGSDISKLQYAKSELEVQKQQLLANNPNISPSSPQLAEINRKIESYKKRIRNLTESLIEESDQYLGFLGSGDGIAQNVSELNQKMIEMQVQQQQYQSQIEVINDQLTEQQRFFNDLPDNIIDLAQLKRDVKINEELFVSVSQQYAETALWEQTQFGLGRIIDQGYVPEEPVEPNKPLYVFVGFVLGGVFSVGYILVRDSLNDRIDGVEKLRSFNPPVLSVIPEMNDYKKEQFSGSDTTEVHGQNLDTGLVTVLNSISPIAEAYRRLQNNIIYSNPDTKLQSIMVTSSGKGEGKTTTISNLGVTLAEAGYRTIIVDTDLRRPNLHNMFGLGRSPGIAEVLFDEVSLNETVRETITPELDILPVGREVPNPSAITQSRAFLDLIANLEAHYDIVLIDTPPMGIITDAAALIQQADGIVAVARFNKTNEPQLNQLLEQLNRLNATIIGTVLTAFDHTATSDVKYGSSYYKEVYKEYSEYSHT